jgi:LacI family transcriptional regulator
MSPISEIISRTRESKSRKPLHECLEEVIQNGLSSGQFKPGQKISMIEEVAGQWNVSRATVQQALQVLAAKGLLVRRPRAGTFLAERPHVATNGTGRSVSLVVPDIQLPEFAALARGIEDAAHEQGMSVVVSSTDHDAARYEQALSRQIEANVSGICMVPPLGYALPMDLLGRLHHSGIPVVTCFRSLYELTGWPMIRTDGYYCMHLLASHLADIGRKRIAFCGFAPNPMSSSRETQMGHYGFLMGLLEHGIVPNPNEMLLLSQLPMGEPESVRSKLELRQRIAAWLGKHPQFDAVCCTHDQEALMVLDVLKKLGRRVPEDVAVTGTGNLARFLGIGPHELTTVDANMAEFGRQFSRRMLDSRSGAAAAAPPAIDVRGKLLIGRSTAGSNTGTTK